MSKSSISKSSHLPMTFPGHNYVAMEISGRRFAPHYEDGDFVIMDSMKPADIEPGQWYVISTKRQRRPNILMPLVIEADHVALAPMAQGFGLVRVNRAMILTAYRVVGKYSPCRQFEKRKEGTHAA